jgi:hypothetical protein
MFDYINCEFFLPDRPDDLDPEFQTKSLSCFLDTYTITKEGRLTKDNGVGTIVDLCYHGVITFYSSAGQYDDAKWIQYKAKFTDGQLVDIKREYVEWNV